MSAGGQIEGAAPRLFTLPPGVDFPQALVAGLAARLADAPPEAWARVTLMVNSGRMARAVRAALDDGPPRLLPRLLHVADLGALAGWPDIPPAMPRLSLVLDLARLLERLTDADPSLAPKHAILDLAERLADLIDEMEGEGADAGALARIDVDRFAAHWQRARSIVDAAYTHFGRIGGRLPGAEARRARVVAALAARWEAAPPEHPVIVAGSTGSRGATRRLMAAVARLPQGAVVVPGFDGHMPADHWAALEAPGGAEPAGGEDHPQYRFHVLMRDLGLEPGDLRAWHEAPPPDRARNRLVSLALCPAPVTDRWRAEAPALGDPVAATAGLSLLEAPSPREEAEAIALRLRAAAEAGRRAALVTPDRELTRHVAAALARWDILPDDSGGTPLHQTPPGRLLRRTARAMVEAPALPDLLALLKHPLAATGGERGAHLLHTRDLELHLRRHAVAVPGAEVLGQWAEEDAARKAWADWLETWLAQAAGARGPAPLAERLRAHLDLTEALAAGAGGTPPGDLWKEAAGRAAEAAMAELAGAAEADAGALAARAYDDLLRAHLSRVPVQDPRLPHPGILIWGTLEARAGGVDLAILAGLNDGTWPDLPPPDAWLNRRMRGEAGLLLPERRIGLAAHDFQQAIAAPEAMLTRATRDAEAQTVPSRWLNRLTNLLNGLGPEGSAALQAMRERGRHWQDLARQVEAPAARVPAAPRPSPRPPVAARPDTLPVTGITTLIRDPYAVYARHVLRLYRLNPLLPVADARERGVALHETMEAFLADCSAWRDDPEVARVALEEAARRHLARHSADPAIRAHWLARLMGVADRLIAGEASRLAAAEPVLTEDKGTLAIGAFRLTARPDRIDRFADGTYAIRDYKSGSPPSPKQVRAFEKQLLLEAAMAERGAFPGLPAARVREMTYISLGASGQDLSVPVTEKDGTRAPDRALEELTALLGAYARRSRGYTARRAAETTRFEGDYDHLARYGEWDLTDDPAPVEVG